MPTLDWIGKNAVVKYHQRIPFHLINQVRTVGDPSEGNILIQGDNLTTLKSLLPYYSNRVKCIYIDPPYNTGKENWVYNDNVNSLEIREWLGKVVGKEAEDLSRHDKWLCMMYPRLLLAKEFLADDGVIFVSIDDNELPLLRILMDELFLPKNHNNMLACFVWQSDGNFDNQAKVKINHEYILAYTKDITKFPSPAVIDPNVPENSKLFKPNIRNTIVKNGPKNPTSPIKIPAGFPADFEEGVISRRDNIWPHYDEDLIIKNYKLQNTVNAISGWSSKKIFESFINNNFEAVKDTKNQSTTFVLTKNGTVEGVKVRTEETQSHVISVLRELGSTQQASAYLNTMGIKFDYPKPVDLIKYLISMVKGNDFIIMDFFAGSGTTGQAVLELNELDQGNRKFVLIEWDTHISTNVCESRLKNIIKGYSSMTEKNNFIEGLGGGFTFCNLGTSLFNEAGQIRDEVSFDNLARHIFFAETGIPIESIKTTEKSPLIGRYYDSAIYLLYNGILKDTSYDSGNVLTREVLGNLPQHKGQRIIYGVSCLISKERLLKEGITFKQIPYEVRVK